MTNVIERLHDLNEALHALQMEISDARDLHPTKHMNNIDEMSWQIYQDYLALEKFLQSPQYYVTDAMAQEYKNATNQNPKRCNKKTTRENPQ